MRDSVYMQREKIYLRVCPCCEKILNREEIHREITAHPEKLYALNTRTTLCRQCLRHSFSGRDSRL